jgi:uncharacterized C2H2 Zn-finger protein
VDSLNTGTALTAFIATTIFTALILAPRYWPFGFALWIIIVAASLVAVVMWHARNTVYRCPECDQLFSISTVTDLVSLHGLGRGGGWKLLTCPKCGSHVRARVYMKDDAHIPP